MFCVIGVCYSEREEGETRFLTKKKKRKRRGSVRSKKKGRLGSCTELRTIFRALRYILYTHKSIYIYDIFYKGDALWRRAWRVI